MVAFRLAWPAFAYSIEDESVAKRTYAFVLTYLLLLCSWVSLVLGLLSPWIVQVLAPTKPEFYRASAAVGLLALGKSVQASLPLAIALCLVYPVVLLPLRFYLPAELRRLRLS